MEPATSSEMARWCVRVPGICQPRSVCANKTGADVQGAEIRDWGNPMGKTKISEDIPDSEGLEPLAEMSLHCLLTPASPCLSWKLLLIVSLSFESPILRKSLIGPGDRANLFLNLLDQKYLRFQIFSFSDWSRGLSNLQRSLWKCPCVISVVKCLGSGASWDD